MMGYTAIELSENSVEIIDISATLISRKRKSTNQSPCFINQYIKHLDTISMYCGFFVEAGKLTRRCSVTKKVSLIQSIFLFQI